jgi:PAS domain S-box-containing protein/putative nucleotidyltransferase with HDIG domain
MEPLKQNLEGAATYPSRTRAAEKSCRRGKSRAEKQFCELIAGSEAWLMQRVLDYASQRHDPEHIATLTKACRLSIADLSVLLLEAWQRSPRPPELGPDEDFSQDPIAAFGILEAKRHRARGASFPMFLGLMKDYRQSYIDLVRQSGFEPSLAEQYRLFIDRFFDRVEIGLCTEWGGITPKAQPGELPAANRAMANEKNRYLTIFECLPSPVLLLDSDHRVSNLNHAAIKLLRGFHIPGGVDYGSEGPGPGPGKTLPFLADDLDAFLTGREPERVVYKSIPTPDGPGFFQIKLQRLPDISQEFQGTVVILNDLTERQKVAEALRESEERYRLLFHSSNDGVFVHPPVTGDQVGTFVEVNDQACQSLGYSREELLKLTPFDLGEPELHDKFSAIRGELLAEKQVLFETVHVAKDGCRLPVEINARLFNYHGRPMVLSLVRDISRRKQAEMEVKRLASFPELNPNPVMEVDAAGVITYCNPATLKVGNPAPEALLPPDLGELMEAARARGERQCYREVRLNGVLYAEDISFPDQFPVARIYAADISARRRMEEQLELKGLLLDSATDLIYLCELDGALIYCNESACTRLGYSRDEMMRHKLPALLTPAYVRRFADRVKILQKQGEATFESAYYRKDRSVMPVEVHARLLTLEGRTHILSVSRDISERKAAAVALLMAAQKWRITFDTIQDAVFLMDRKSRIIQANQALAALVNKPFREIIGRPCYEVLHNITSHFANCPVVRMWESCRREVLVFPAGERWFKAAVDPIRNESGEVTGAVHTVTDITDAIRADTDLRNSLEKLQRTLSGTVSALASTVGTRDPYTSGHQQRVADLAAAIALEMRLSPEQVEGMRVIGLLHDIGKIAIPAELLSKPGKLNPTEFNLIKDHPQAGYEILKAIEFPWPLAQAVLQHHERLDGSGYPLGIKNGEIIPEAKILMVADVVEAMASHRPYRPALGIDKALAEISRNQGTLYDPEVVAACTRVFNEKAFSFSGERTPGYGWKGG